MIKNDGHMNRLEQLFIYSKTRDWFINHYELPKLKLNFINKSVLEIGCGSGGAACFCYNNKASKYLGIDINPKAIELAKSKFSNLKNVSFECKDINQLIDCQFDIIICSGLLHHIKNWRQFLDEATNLIIDDGLICVIDIPIGGLIYNRIFNKLFGKPLSEFYIGEIQEQLYCSGFQQIKLIEPWWYPLFFYVGKKKYNKIDLDKWNSIHIN